MRSAWTDSKLWIVLVLTSACVPQQLAAGEEAVPRRSQREFALAANPDAKVVQIGGFFRAQHEGPLQSGVRLRLNGVLLTDKHLLGPKAATTPLYGKCYGVLYPRYNPAAESFCFKPDADGICNNGPWVTPGMAKRYKTNHYLDLQLDVSGILRAGANTLRVTNGAGSDFVVTTLTCSAACQELPDPWLTPPAWVVLAKSPEERAAYEALLRADKMPPADAAETLASLGIADIVGSGQLQSGLAFLWRALEKAPAFPSRGEALYRIVAARVTSGEWPVPEADFRAALLATTPEDSWLQLARTLLGVLDKKPAENPRLIVPVARGDERMRADGVLDEPFWTKAAWHTIAYDPKTKKNVERPTHVKFFALTDALAVAFQGPLPAGVAWPVDLGHDEAVWRGNATELLLAADLQFGVYHELNVSPLGTRFDARNRWRCETDTTWNGAWEAEGRIDGDGFVVEYRIPWTEIGLRAAPAPGNMAMAGAFRMDTGVEADRSPRLLTITPYEEPDCHRMMDSAVLLFE